MYHTLGIFFNPYLNVHEKSGVKIEFVQVCDNENKIVEYFISYTDKWWFALHFVSLCSVSRLYANECFSARDQIINHRDREYVWHIGVVKICNDNVIMSSRLVLLLLLLLFACLAVCLSERLTEWLTGFLSLCACSVTEIKLHLFSVDVFKMLEHLNNNGTIGVCALAPFVLSYDEINQIIFSKLKVHDMEWHLFSPVLVPFLQHHAHSML